MFPICDEQGRVIAFSGRVLAGDEKTAKYVNSPETPIFTKGKVFFGLDKSKRAILDAEFAIICEGQLDLIAAYMAGIRNIVAPQGTAFTPEHARILKRYVNEVVLCFDSDTAGQNAAVRVLDSLAASGLAIRVATIPAPHDPDSFIKEQGAAAFEQLIKAAPGFFDFYLTRLCTENDPASDKGRLNIVTEMGAALAKTGNAVLLDTYASKTAQRLGVSIDAIRAEFKKSAPRQRQVEPTTAPQETDTMPATSVQEKLFLRLLLQNDDHVPHIADRLDAAWIKHRLVQQVTAKRLELHERGEWKDVPAFLPLLDDSAKALVSEVLIAPLVAHRDGTRHQSKDEIPKPLEQLDAIMTRFRNDALDVESKRLNQRLATPDISDEEKVLILQRQTAIRELKRRPLAKRAS
jgi:DNA primase